MSTALLIAVMKKTFIEYAVQQCPVLTQNTYLERSYIVNHNIKQAYKVHFSFLIELKSKLITDKQLNRGKGECGCAAKAVVREETVPNVQPKQHSEDNRQHQIHILEMSCLTLITPTSMLGN